MVIIGNGDAIDIQGAEVRNAAKCLTMHKTACYNSHLIYNDSGAAVEKLWSRGGYFHQQQGLYPLYVLVCHSLLRTA